MSQVPILGYARPLVRKDRSLRNVPPNPAVNTDRHRRAFGPAGRPVTFVR